MPKGREWIVFLFINIFFVALWSRVYLTVTFQNIKMNWPKYRCNPLFMPMSDDPMKDFNTCTQQVMGNFMKQLMQPIMYLVNGLSKITNLFDGNILNIRKMFNYIREQVMFIIKSLFNVFMSLIVEFQRLIVSIKDLVMKVIGIVTVMINLIDGSVKTGQSAWNGPPGQMIREVGNLSCFHPETLVELNDKTIKPMKDLDLGDVLKDGSLIKSVMKFKDCSKETYYKFENKGVQGSNLFVTGRHFVLDKSKNTFVHVENHPEAIEMKDMDVEIVYCFITSTHLIGIGEMTFWDWEDDCMYSFDSNGNKQPKTPKIPYVLDNISETMESIRNFLNTRRSSFN